MEKENITVDMASSLAVNGGRKKSRSKSVGPGGLDALKPGSGNRRVSIAAPVKPPPRSILKPTIPPLPEIPSYKSKHSRISPPSMAGHGADKLPHLFQNDDSNSSGTKIALRTEEEQQAAAREREERERAQLEKEINDRREARRKSLANRRVSFAAEATLHTFHEVEYMQDSTTSTDSTRRASSLAANHQDPEPSDPPSTPPEQEDDIVPDSPENQRDMHQRNRRRSSGVRSLNFNNNNDDTLASSVYSSDSEGTEGPMEVHEEIGSDSGSDSDADGVTMDIDVEVTGTSVASAMSARSVSPDESSDTLDSALRLASRQAVTQSLDEEEEIIPSFGWARKPAPAPKQPSPLRDQENTQNALKADQARDNYEQEDTEGMDMDMDMDMDMTNAVGGIIKTHQESPDDAEEEMSMDVTRVLGGILPQRNRTQKMQFSSPDKNEEDSAAEDAPMDFTTAVGGIRKGPQSENSLFDPDDNEDMSMEITSAIGGFLSSNNINPATRQASQSRRRTIARGDDEATMDMTVGMGRIIPAGEDDENDEDATTGMDMTMTMAMGGIIKGPPSAKDRTEARQVMEQEADEDDSVPGLRSSSKRRLSAAIAGKGASETGSPGLSMFRGNGLRRSNGWQESATPKSSSPVRNVSPPKSASPFKLGTPNKQGPRTPLKDPPARKSKSPSASKTRRGSNVASTPRSASKNGQATSIFQQDPTTGVSTPRVVLTPQRRRLSGVGADRPGLGSPKVAAIFDRRGSIGDTADDFVPREITRNVSFANPQILEFEIERERQLELEKESGQLYGGADGADEDHTTASLKDMISSMTPKKNPFKGRKSLHVGSAKGLLGKRPMELDDDEEAEERDGIKRLKNHQSSPVKNVRLHAPPSKAETTGRMTRSASKELENVNDYRVATTPVLSPRKTPAIMSSPRGKERFGEVESIHPPSQTTLNESQPVFEPDVQMDDNDDNDDDGERIHLQDFLNMTNIRFMELTTTKRRHTQAPNTSNNGTMQGDEDISLQRCVVAGACTVPMLELFQHSCRELKKYISEGRKIVHEIETETLEENPALFKEYMSATPEYKAFMDNQFKNVKTHARLLSKAMWYEWRMKLQDGLKEGLVNIGEGMEADEELLHKQQELLDSILPALTKQFESLVIEHDNLQSAAQELADDDPEELQMARSELEEVDLDIQAKMQQIEQLRQQLDDTESGISELSEKKQACISDIEKAEKIREANKGWATSDVAAAKAKYDEVVKRHGWSLLRSTGEHGLALAYLGEIEVIFDCASFAGLKPNGTIELFHISREENPTPPTPEKLFFLQCIRNHVRGLVQKETRPKDFLDMISAGWKKAKHTAENVRLLNCSFRTTVTRVSDHLAIKALVLLTPCKTKIEITLNLHGQSTPTGIEVNIVPQARVVYGEQFKAENIVEFLTAKIGTRVLTNEEQGSMKNWGDVVVELEEKLLATGQK